MLYGIGLRQHVVEFIKDTGMVTDGVVDATSTSGPWTWQVPADCAMLDELAAGGGGGGGGAGHNAGTSMGGGGGGGSGCVCRLYDQPVVPGALITITLGTAGAGGALGANASAGGNTRIEGIIRPMTGGVIHLPGGQVGTRSTASPGGTGGQGGNFSSGGGTGGAAGTAGNAATSTATTTLDVRGFQANGGSGGGGANASGSVAGAACGAAAGYSSSYNTTMLPNGAGNAFPGGGVYGGAGNTDGTNSYGGGGIGGFAPEFGSVGFGGNGNATPAEATGYCSGGGGGGGGAPGANGRPGYARIVYRSAL